MTTPCGMTPRSIKSTDGMFGQGCAKPGCASSNDWTGPSLCSSRGATYACAVARRHCADWHRPKRRRPSPRAQPANPKKRALGWRTSRSGLALLYVRPSRHPMLAAEPRRSGQRQMERRAKAARRSSRLRYPKTAARGLHQSRSAPKNQNPQNGHLMARFDWGLGAICFGASPVAAVFGSAPGSATPPEHRIHCKPSSQAALLKQDISTLLGIGHFYFALTGAFLPPPEAPPSDTLDAVIRKPANCALSSSPTALTGGRATNSIPIARDIWRWQRQSICSYFYHKTGARS